jgi:hypothetical protein
VANRRPPDESPNEKEFEIQPGTFNLGKALLTSVNFPLTKLPFLGYTGKIKPHSIRLPNQIMTRSPAGLAPPRYEFHRPFIPFIEKDGNDVQDSNQALAEEPVRPA